MVSSLLVSGASLSAGSWLSLRQQSHSIKLFRQLCTSSSTNSISRRIGTLQQSHSGTRSRLGLQPYRQPSRSLQRWVSTTGSLSDKVLTSTTTTIDDGPTDFSILPPYSPPTTGLISKLPASLVPYAELIRIDKPAGTYYLYFPCLFGTLLAAPAMTPIPSISQLLYINALFLAGSFIMRSAGCTINDLWDRNLDPHVVRTRHRPIARGAISARDGTLFFGAQCLAGLGILAQFPIACLPMAIPSLSLVVLYPLAKRVTYYPQFVLGLTFSWGALLGFPALGADLFAIPGAITATGLLYASTGIWTVLYDMIYAHMDVRDDAKAGIKSIILAHGHMTKPILTGLAIAQLGTLAGAGFALGASPVFYALSCAGGAAALGTMIRRVRLEDPADCWWWFRNGSFIVGGTIAAGLGAEYGYQLWLEDQITNEEDEDGIARIQEITE